MELQRRGGMKVNAVRKSAFEISKNSFNRTLMLVSGLMHELRSFVDRKSDIRSRDSSILEGPYYAPIEVRVGHRRTIEFGERVIGCTWCRAWL